MQFLPVTRQEMIQRNWQSADIIIVTGDAYIDHPSFGTAIISRVLEKAGFKVCIVSQPKEDSDYEIFGKPRLAFFVNSGNIDSMVAHYTAAKKKRSQDAYSPGGKSGARPDRAVTVYSRTIRRLFPDTPIAIGGIEASLRRFAHYDYWSDSVMPSILIDSDADILMYGMGEKHCVEIAQRLANGEDINNITDILGTCYAVDTTNYTPMPCVECPSYELVKENSDSGKKQYAISCRIQQNEHDFVRGRTVIQRHGKKIVIQNPPMPPLDTAQLDEIYALPFMRQPHPIYSALGGVPAIEEVKFSVIHNRGCFGACNFCSLAYHQGRFVSSRSHESVIDEVKKISQMPDFKGYIHDIGGPTANFRQPACDAQDKRGACSDRKCLAPQMCRSVNVDHRDYIELLRKLRKLPKVKKVFIRSGIRFDYLIADRDETFFKELVEHHISGQLKVAPEHCSDRVLKYMGKPGFEVYKKFKNRFYELTKSSGKKQFLVPYLMSSHPGSTVNDAIELALFLKKEKMHPEQVQDFYPTPGTVSTCMFYTGLDPFTLEKVYVPRSPREKAEQRALLQYYNPGNRQLVLSALKKARRYDLIGTAPHCLVPPEPKQNRKTTHKTNTRIKKKY